MTGAAAVAQSPTDKRPVVDYRPLVGDLNAAMVLWDWKQPTYAHVAAVASIGCGAARTALSQGYARQLSDYFKSIKLESEPKVEFSDFLQAEVKAFQKAGANEQVVARLTHRLKIRPSLERSTFDEAVYAKGLVQFEALSCGSRLPAFLAASKEPSSDAKRPASPEYARRGECIIDMMLGLGVGAVDAAIAVFGPEVVTPYPAMVISYLSGSWAWDEMKDGWTCK
jgi:hypothetical protein